MEFRPGQLVKLRSKYPGTICVWVWPSSGNVFNLPNETCGIYIGLSRRYKSPRCDVLIGEQIGSVPWDELVPA